MKIFSPQELKTVKDQELAMDILRTKAVKEAKETAEKELNFINASFEVALANQRMRWMTEEREATEKLGILQKEIEELEARKAKNIPIESEEEKTDNITNILIDKIDDVSTREQDLNERERRLEVREKACEEERVIIKKYQEDISKNLINIIK